jgi:site-specific DNA-methyltransferase (adenine-specific)
VSRLYSVILADPPWRYNDRRVGHGGAEGHYPTMNLDEIKALRIPAAANCALFIWATCPLIGAALETVNAWGFTYRTTAFVWIKLNPSGRGLATGLGHWTRANAEICLLATRGRPRPISHRVHSVVISPRGRHSEKPDEVRRRIVELMGAEVPKLEMFARTRTPGWDVWGNEVAGSIVLEAPTKANIRAVPASRKNEFPAEGRRIRCAG